MVLHAKKQTKLRKEMCYFSGIFSTVCANKGPPAKTAKFLLQVKYEQPRLTMSHASQLDLCY